MKLFLKPATFLVFLGFLFTTVACGWNDANTSHNDQFDSESHSDHYPVSISNCGHVVVFNAAPQRIILLETSPVTILEGIGVLDAVIARAGDFPAEYYGDDLNSAISDVPSISEDLDASGHLMLSQEEVVARNPDLALGLPDGVTRAGLGDSGINLLEQELYCPDPQVDAKFDTLFWEIARYGEIFDAHDPATSLVNQLQDRIAAVEESATDQEQRTAAVLYPAVDGGVVYAYGAGSMAQPQLEAAGFDNVFEDSTDRVFEVQTEELVGRDPDVLVLLYQGDVDGVEEAVTALPGADTITAVQNDDILTQLFNFTEPATPLTVDGLELIAERFHR